MPDYARRLPFSSMSRQASNYQLSVRETRARRFTYLVLACGLWRMRTCVHVRRNYFAAVADPRTVQNCWLDVSLMLHYKPKRTVQRCGPL